MGNSPRTASTCILDDDCLLHVFHFYRPFFLGEDDGADARLKGGMAPWARGRWWYRLTHVCQRWRNIILGSASYLGVSLVCTYGTPVADMLKHSPPFPLIIDYNEKGRDIATDDEEGIIVALKQRERVLRVRLNSSVPVTSQRKFIDAMDEEYPILEYLLIGIPDEDVSTILICPETLQAPQLRLLWLRGFALPMGSRLLTGTTAVGLVTLSLVMIHPSTYFQPNTLLQWVSLMTQVEELSILFKFPIPNRDVERQLTRAPIIALPNLRQLQFRGVFAYLEALVHRITAPRLERLDIDFFNRLIFSVPRLLQFMDTTVNLRFNSAVFNFHDKYVSVAVLPRHKAEMFSLGILVFCRDLDWQISSMVQFSNFLSQFFSAVEHLTLQHEEHEQSSEEHNKVYRTTEWHRLLRPFSNVKTLQIDIGLVKDLSRCLKSEDGGLSLELLPELQRLTYAESRGTRDVFASFIDARRNAGRPVTLARW